MNTRQLTPLDLTPFYRNSIGIGRLTNMFERLERQDPRTTTYPPYNIIDIGNDKHRIEIAIAGFGSDDITVTVEDGVLLVEGEQAETEDDTSYVHHGLAGRSFRRSFELVDHVEVTEASLKNGVLIIDLERIIPEALKPKQIKVKLLK